MSKTDLHIQENLTTWLSPFFDDDTKKTIQQLQASNPEELNDSFYKNLRVWNWWYARRYGRWHQPN